MTIAELSREVAGRVGAAPSNQERDRVLDALEKLLMDKKLIPEDRRKIFERLERAKDKVKELRKQSGPWTVESGRGRLLQCLDELEKRTKHLKSIDERPREQRREERRDEKRRSRSPRHDAGKADSSRNDDHAGRSSGGLVSQLLAKGDKVQPDKSEPLFFDEPMEYDPEERVDHDDGEREERGSNDGTDAEPDQEVEWVSGHYPWVCVKDAETGDVYYFNEETTESSWDHPETHTNLM